MRNEENIDQIAQSKRAITTLSYKESIRQLPYRELRYHVHLSFTLGN